MTYMLIPVVGLVEVLMTETDPTMVLTARKGRGTLVELNLTLDNIDVGRVFLMLDEKGLENDRAQQAMFMLTDGVYMTFRGPVLFDVNKDQDVFDLLRRLS